jgi:hypothetical protein
MVASRVVSARRDKKLPADFVPGQVAIHHSPAAYGGNFEVIASYDADQPGPMPMAHHFDVNGAEVVMANEQEPNLVSSIHHGH